MNGFRTVDFNKIITSDIFGKIRKVDHFSKSQYANLDIGNTLLFYTNRYVRQLFDFTSLSSDKIIADIGAGYGWLSMAFVLTTGCKVIAIDPDRERLYAGRQIAKYIGIDNKIDWRVGGLGKLPVSDKETDIAYCIEVIEHVNRSADALHDLSRIAKDLLIITTPNLWFPVIAHDTQLPFCHWLPIPLRKIYARLFNRLDWEYTNLFWSPISLRKNLKGFKPVSKWLHYSSYKTFQETFPFYLPYSSSGVYVNNLSKSKRIYYGIISKLGMYSHSFTPSLAYVFKRQNKI